MYYGQAGGKNFLLRKWRDLSDDIEVFCDGRDITPKIREHRVHSVLFSNIPHFSSGTRPWNNSVSLQINTGCPTFSCTWVGLTCILSILPGLMGILQKRLGRWDTL